MAAIVEYRKTRCGLAVALLMSLSRNRQIEILLAARLDGQIITERKNHFVDSINWSSESAGKCLP